MLRLAKRAALFAPPALLLLSLPFFNGCDSSEPLSPPPDTSPSFEILDAAHSMGNPDFFFLPPLVPNPSGSEWFDDGEFDAGLSPSVEICAAVPVGDGKEECPEGSPPVASFTMDGTDPVQVSEMDQHYHVNWRLDDFDLDPQVTYRIRVLLGDNEVGHADVDLVSSGKELKNVDTGQYIPLKDGRTLPIKFRLEEGVGSYVGPSGGTVSAEDGSWSLEIEKGTFETSVGITASLLSDPDGALPGTAWDFGPEGTEFNPPAILTIWYNPDDLTPEKYPRLHKLIDGVWQPVEGSVADLTAGTVTGPVTGFSVWAVLGTEVNLDIYVTGGRGEVKIDGWTPPVGTPPCDHGYPDPPCTAILDYGAPVTLIADEIGFPDGLFEEWLGDVSDFECPTDEKICSFTMTGDRSVTARFSMPGLITADPNTVSFEMPQGGGAPPPSQEVTISLVGGRDVGLEGIYFDYEPAGAPPWMEALLSGDVVTESDPITMTLSVVPKNLPPGDYSVIVRTGNFVETVVSVVVTLTVTPVGVQHVFNGAAVLSGYYPVMVYTLTDELGSDIYPVGDDECSLAGYYPCHNYGFFDTGSTLVVLDAYNAGLLGLGAASSTNPLQDTRVRISGPDAVDPIPAAWPPGPGASIGAPGTSDGAQFEKADVRVALPNPRPDPGVTLIGAPVANEVTALIDQNTGVQRGHYICNTDDCFQAVMDITFFEPTDATIPVPDLRIALERFGSAGTSGTDLADEGFRYLVRNVAFREEGRMVMDDPSAEPSLNFFHDTGTPKTIVNSRVATALGLDLAAGGEFDCFEGPGKAGFEGYEIDRISMVGSDSNGGTYSVEQAWICVDVRDEEIRTYVTPGTKVDAIIGMNLFMFSPFLFEGKDNTIGIMGQPE